MKPVKLTRGLRGYASVLATLAEPMTKGVLAERVGTYTTGLHPTLRRMHSYGLIHISGWTRSKPCGPYAALWKAGPGTDADYPIANTPWRWADRSGDVLAVRSELLVFKHVMDALVDPHTSWSLRDITGADRVALRDLLRHMHGLGLVRIAGWERASNGIPMPLYQLGRGRDVDRPRAVNHTDCCRVNQAKARAKRATLHLIHLTAAPIPRPLPLAA